MPVRGSRGGGSEDWLAIAAVPVVLGIAAIAAMAAASVSTWLAVPAALLGLAIGIGIASTTIGRGLMVACAYSLFAFAVIGGPGHADREGAGVLVAIIVFVWVLRAMYRAWKRAR
jgi:hypothetical protein